MFPSLLTPFLKHNSNILSKTMYTKMRVFKSTQALKLSKIILFTETPHKNWVKLIFLPKGFKQASYMKMKRR